MKLELLEVDLNLRQVAQAVELEVEAENEGHRFGGLSYVDVVVEMVRLEGRVEYPLRDVERMQVGRKVIFAGHMQHSLHRHSHLLSHSGVHSHARKPYPQAHGSPRPASRGA